MRLLVCAFFAISSLLVSPTTLLAATPEQKRLLADSERDIDELRAMLAKHAVVTRESFTEVRMFINIQASLTLADAKRAGADTTVLERELAVLKRTLHERNIKRIIAEMEKFAMLPVDVVASTEPNSEAWEWRHAFRDARENGVLISAELEKRRKDLEVRAFEQKARVAVKELRDFVECRPSRFASAGRLHGWNVYFGALLEQTKIPILIVDALDSPNASKIVGEYDRARDAFDRKFPYSEFGRTDYEKVCGDERRKYDQAPAK